MRSGAIYNPQSQTYVRQKLRLFYKMTQFKLYVNAFKRVSRAFIQARDPLTFGHLLMITLYIWYIYDLVPTDLCAN